MKKKNSTNREPLFVRIKKVNKTFLFNEQKRMSKFDDSVTVQDTVDSLVAGYRKLKKTNPRLADKFF